MCEWSKTHYDESRDNGGGPSNHHDGECVEGEDGDHGQGDLQPQRLQVLIDCRAKHADGMTLAATLEGSFTPRTCRRQETRRPLGVETEPTSKTCLIRQDFTKRLRRGAEVLKLRIEGQVRPG